MIGGGVGSALLQPHGMRMKSRTDWLKAAASLSGKLGAPTSPELLEPHKAPGTKGTKVGPNPGTKIWNCQTEVSGPRGVPFCRWVQAPFLPGILLFYVSLVY